MVQINNPLNNSFFRVDFGGFIADLSDGDNVAGNEPPLFVGDNFENRRNAADAVGGKVAAAVRDEAVAVKFDGASDVRPCPNTTSAPESTASRANSTTLPLFSP